MSRTYRNYPIDYSVKLKQGRDGAVLDLKDSGRELPGYSVELLTKKAAKKLRNKRRRRNHKSIDLID